MDVTGLLLEFYGRIPPLARRAVEGLSRDDLFWTPVPGANPIGWLIWHMTRVQDHHIAEILEMDGADDADQIWVGGDRAARFGLEPDPSNHGYGHTADDVATVRPDGIEVLLDYLDAVQSRTVKMLMTLTPSDLDRIVDRRWDPPVTLGVRLVSVADDCCQHAGQAAYVRGLLLA